ncbi:major facilitator superfamily domain-containing protein [Aspergillus granulosus]|uniref:Major facilitator superfamily domain-containing protein n=1 Tax=Aspergillus granulosus TaxID=176169 RepID=A0ABR4GXL5_9EURO
MASAIDSAIIDEAAAKFSVSNVTVSLATGLYLVGFGVSALITSPLSEMIGRASPEHWSAAYLRFLAGLVCSTPLTVVGGSISDIWNALEKTFGFPIFGFPGFGGLFWGHAYIGYNPHISWRWSEWTMLIFDGFVIAIVFLAKRETFAPQLLFYKARFFRQERGDQRFRAKDEASGIETWLPVLTKHFSRPWILFIEPIVICFTFYLTVVYIVLIMFLDGYPFIFGDTYGINSGLVNIYFVGLFIGIVLTMLMCPARLPYHG